MKKVTTNNKPNICEKGLGEFKTFNIGITQIDNTENGEEQYECYSVTVKSPKLTDVLPHYIGADMSLTEDEISTIKAECETTTKAELVSALVRSKYSASDVEAILLNKTKDDGDEGHEDEHTALQEWRDKASEIAAQFVDDDTELGDDTESEVDKINKQLGSSSVVVNKLKLLLASITVKDANGNEVENGATIELPFKLGYKWEAVNSNGTISYTLVKDDTAIGLENNPIAFVAGVKLLPNAFYTYNEKTYVYMGAEGIAGEWSEVESSMAEW